MKSIMEKLAANYISLTII